jgi:hypothetical protein
VYTLALLLTDRNKFLGGNVVIRKARTEDKKDSKKELDFEEELDGGGYDEEDEDEEQRQHEEMMWEKKLREDMAKDEEARKKREKEEEEKKKKKRKGLFRGRQSDSEDKEGETLSTDGEDDLLKKRKIPRIPFDAMSTGIARYTPERGGGILMKSYHQHGTHTVTHGRRVALMIEFWPFQDATIGQKKPSIKEALPFIKPPGGDEL